MNHPEIQISVEDGAYRVLAALNRAGYQAYAVGGCVRDALLGKTPHDWDICTDARPEQVVRVFGEQRCIPTGMRHGTVSVRMNRTLYEVTTFRTEGSYTDGRHPDSVDFIQNVEDDLARRDFTVNAMAYHPDRGVIDPFDGYEDLLEKNLIRAVGVPEERFGEDALRILRLYRFAARFSLLIDPGTAEAAVSMAGNLKKVSAERIREEFLKLLEAEKPSEYLEPRVISVFLPELYSVEGELPERTLSILDRVRAGDDLRISALLQDIALLSGVRKAPLPDNAEDPEGSRIAERILRRLRCSNEQTARVCALIRFHCFMPEPDEAGRRVQALHLLNRIGPENLRLLLELKEAGQREAEGGLTEFRQTLDGLLRENACYTISGLRVNGNDLMKEFGLQKGPVLGKLLGKLLALVLSEKLRNDRAELLGKVRELLREQ